MTAERRTTAGWNREAGAEQVHRVETNRAALMACHEFLVDREDGTPLGVVDDVVLTDDGDLVALLVAVGWFGRRIIRVAPEEVVAIQPEDRRLTVEQCTESKSARGLPEQENK